MFWIIFILSIPIIISIALAIFEAIAKDLTQPFETVHLDIMTGEPATPDEIKFNVFLAISGIILRYGFILFLVYASFAL